jgi:hypothetical protein
MAQSQFQRLSWVSVFLLAPMAAAQTYAPAWPAPDGRGGAFVSAISGFASSGSTGGPVKTSASSQSLPQYSSAQSFASSVVMDAHASYILSGAGSSSWCAAVNNTACKTCLPLVPSTMVTALSLTGATLWSSAVPRQFDLPCNYTAGAWISPIITLHPNMSIIYAQGSW